jgi:hypothetical protein
MNSISAKRAAQLPENTGKDGTKTTKSAGVPHYQAYDDVGAQFIAPLHHHVASQQVGWVAGEQETPVGNIVTITCPLCDAQFTPEPEHAYLHSVEPDALEAAFQSVCHVCFRCHRSACPECWDNVHRVCGACVQEAGLTFRTEAAPLAGLLFPPAAQAFSTAMQSSPTPFVCIQPGRFEIERQHSSDTDTPAAIPSLNDKDVSIADFRPSGRTRTAQAPHPHIIHHSRPYEFSSEGPRRIEAQQASEDVDDEMPAGLFARICKVIERVVTIMLLLVLLAVAAAIVLAEVSRPANAWFARFLHVDIRAEIAYLITLIRQIHW